MKKTTFIKNGDQKSISIAAASIIAKTWRDRLMTLYSKIYPMYGWEKNKGYGTHEHRNAIKKFGLTKIHRKSFLRNFIYDLESGIDILTSKPPKFSDFLSSTLPFM